MGTTRLDLHVHTSFSPDGRAPPEEMVRAARALGMAGIAITDHNTVDGIEKAVALAGEEGVIVVPGIEVSSSDGHILGYGLKAHIKRDMSPEETIEAIHDAGGIAVAPHPYRFWSGLGEEVVKRCKFDAVEGVNSRSTKHHNALAQQLAKELGLGTTGGSDSHGPATIGESFTEMETAPATADDVIEAMKKGMTKGGGRSRKPVETAHYVYKSVSQWMGRGLKKM